MGSLDLLNDRILGCTQCALSQTRTLAVPGVGHPNAQIMFVGEGPGEEEDRLGQPFVGRSGHLLTEALGKVGLGREEVYITNVVKCRPPNNRDPYPTEVLTCKSYLAQQIDYIKPKIVVALGRIAAGHLLQREVRITKEHGKLEPLSFNDDILVSILYHPSYVLRNRKTAVEEAFYQDLREARDIAYATVTFDPSPTGCVG